MAFNAVNEILEDYSIYSSGSSHISRIIFHLSAQEASSLSLIIRTLLVIISQSCLYGCGHAHTRGGQLHQLPQYSPHQTFKLAILYVTGSEFFHDAHILQCFDVIDPRVYSHVIVDQFIQSLGRHTQAALQICTYGQ
jgi:hypothetical protein